MLFGKIACKDKRGEWGYFFILSRNCVLLMGCKKLIFLNYMTL